MKKYKKYDSSGFIPVANILFHPKKNVLMFHTLRWEKKWDKTLKRLLIDFLKKGIIFDTILEGRK